MWVRAPGSSTICGSAATDAIRFDLTFVHMQILVNKGRHAALHCPNLLNDNVPVTTNAPSGLKAAIVQGIAGKAYSVWEEGHNEW